MGNNINTVPARVENSFVAQSSAKVEKTDADEKNVNLVEQVSKADSDEQIVAQKKESVEAKLEEKISAAEIQTALEVVSSFVNSTLKQVDFSNDSSSGKMVIKVSDRETKEVIQQFPSEKIITMAEKIRELQQEVQNISGLLIDSHI